jgi:CBS domain-containing protein
VVRHHSVKVESIMTANPLAVGPTTPFFDIVECLLTHNINALPVVDRSGALVGIVTESDLITREAYEAYDEERRSHLGLIRDHLARHDSGHDRVRKAEGRVAQDLMTTQVQTMSPTDDLATAARVLLEGRHKSLPVVSDGRLVGIVSRRDLLRPFHRSDEEIAADIEAILVDPHRAPASHDVRCTVRKGIVILQGTTRIRSDAYPLVAFIAEVPGVVAIDDELGAREHESGLRLP